MCSITHDHEYTNKQKNMGMFFKDQKDNEDDALYDPIVTARKSTIEELKRLQLEIDEAEQVKEDLGFVFAIGEANDYQNEAYDKAHETIESNTARIAEIILNEL